MSVAEKIKEKIKSEIESIQYKLDNLNEDLEAEKEFRELVEGARKEDIDRRIKSINKRIEKYKLQIKRLESYGSND